jgi:hypothetical protein
MGDGWTSSKLELTKIQLLDRVHQATADGEVPGLYSYARDLADDWETVQSAADTLVTEGLTKDDGPLGGGSSLYLTPAGTTAMLERRERRSDRRRRAVACRDALLDWSYGRNARDIGEFAGDVRAHFEGEPFTREEIIDAARDLMEREYLTGRESLVPHTVIGPQITAKGKAVIEHYDSSIASYENRSQPAAGGQTVIKIKTGRVTGQISVGDNNRLSQKTGAHAGELTELIAAVIDAAKGTPEEDRVGNVMAQLELEADRDEPDPTIIGKMLDRAQDIADDTINEGLKGALKKLAYVAFGWYVQRFGGGN